MNVCECDCECECEYMQSGTFVVSELWLLNRYSIKMNFVLNCYTWWQQKSTDLLMKCKVAPFLLSWVEQRAVCMLHSKWLGLFALDFHRPWIRWFITERQTFCLCAEVFMLAFSQKTTLISANWISIFFPHHCCVFTSKNQIEIILNNLRDSFFI